MSERTDNIIFCEGFRYLITEIPDISDKITDGYCYVEIFSKLPTCFYSTDGYDHFIICQLFFNKRPYDESKIDIEDKRIRLHDFNMITYYEGFSDINDYRYKFKNHLDSLNLDSYTIMHTRRVNLYAII